MLIVCANVSNLLLARAMTRRKEIGIRLAVGATPGRVIRQLLTESLLLAGLAGGVGTLMAMYGLHLFARFGPVGLIHEALPHINARVLGFSLSVSVVASVIFGLAPALHLSRIGSLETDQGSRDRVESPEAAAARINRRLRSMRVRSLVDWRRPAD